MISLWTPARRMFFSIRRPWPSSSSIMTMLTGLACLFTSCGSGLRGQNRAQVARQVQLHRGSLLDLRSQRDLAAEVADHAAAVILDLDDDALAARLMSADLDPQRAVRRPVFHGVVEQVADDLLQRHAV